MVTTKITITSVELEFSDYNEFENYCEYLLGSKKYVEFSYLFRDPMFNGTMLPYEKSHWDIKSKSGYVQWYHEASLHSREFQLSVIKSPIFVELQQALNDAGVSLSIEMLPSDEFEISTSSEFFVDINNSGTLNRRPGI
jgi:hypothetical protein